MSRTSPADRSELSLPDLEEIARQTGLVRRRSKRFSAGGFLQTLLGAVVTGLGSFNQLAGSLGGREDMSMARQSIHERFGPGSTAFLLAVNCELMTQRFDPVAPALEKSAVRRIIIEDASSQVMPKANAADFPAHGNHHGATAGVKVDFTYDILSGEVISHMLQGGTAQDKTTGREAVAQVMAGDLVVRDMGYFALGEFTDIELRDAWWLSRLPLTTGVMLESGKSLEKWLHGGRGDLIDGVVYVGEERKKCRLVAVRAERKVVAKRRAERRKKARESGKTPCPKGLARDAWHIMLTNLGPDQATVAQLMEVYRARWAVEIQFRAWKQSLNLTKALNRRSGEHHMHALVLAAMIAHQLGMKMARVVGARIGRASLSYEKLYDLLADFLVKAHDFASLLDFDPDPRHVSRDKRARENPIESGITALT